MTASWRRIISIFIKDYKDFSRNMAVSIVIFLPPVLAALYNRSGAVSLEAQYMIINLTFAMVATFVQSCLIAEEKDKNTLRGLMLSPASVGEILIGKSLLSFALTISVIIISSYFSGYRPENLGLIAIALIISSFFYIGLGTFLGLITKSVMEASVFIMPVMIIFSFGSSILAWSKEYAILKVLYYLPNVQLIELAEKVEQSASLSKLLPYIGVISIWVIVVSLLTVNLYKKRQVD